MITIPNINQVSDKHTSGNNIGYKVWLIHKDQIDQSVAFPSPDAGGDIGTIPLKSGEYMNYFEAIDDSLSDSSKGTKGDVTSSVVNTLSFIIGGNTLALRTFLENHIGDKFLVILQEIDSKDYFLYGSFDKMLKLKEFDRANNKESRSTTLTFENNSFAQPARYVGAITSAPSTTLAANATTIPFTSAAQQYTTGTNTSATTITAFTGLLASDAGRVVVIIGGGSTYPSKINSSASIVLRNAAAWTGARGSSLTLKVLDVNTLVEISRVQTT